MDSILLFPIDRAWVEERERQLIANEDAMFRAARDRASTDAEREYWDDFLCLRDANLRARHGATR